jgi:hypothetical protein
MEKPVSELEDEEQVAPPMGQLLEPLSPLVELRLLHLELVPQGQQRVEELLVVPDDVFGSTYSREFATALGTVPGRLGFARGVPVPASIGACATCGR